MFNLCFNTSPVSYFPSQSLSCTVTANVSAESDSHLCKSSAMNRFQLYLPVIIQQTVL